MGFRLNLPDDVQRTHDACQDAWKRWHTEWCRLRNQNAPDAICEIYRGVVDHFHAAMLACRANAPEMTWRRCLALQREAAHPTPSEQRAIATASGFEQPAV
jgi:hypothetical protein